MSNLINIKKTITAKIDLEVVVKIFINLTRTVL